MSKIEINIIIDDGGITPEMQRVLAALGNIGVLQKTGMVRDSVPEKIEEPKKVRKPYTLGEEEPVKPEKVEPTEVKTETAPKEEPGKESKHTIEEVRELAVSKGKQHREAVKAKITELGAANLVKLDPSHYETFVAFLNTLGD